MLSSALKQEAEPHKQNSEEFRRPEDYKEAWTKELLLQYTARVHFRSSCPPASAEEKISRPDGSTKSRPLGGWEGWGGPTGRGGRGSVVSEGANCSSSSSSPGTTMPMAMR